MPAPECRVPGENRLVQRHQCIPGERIPDKALGCHRRGAFQRIELSVTFKQEGLKRRFSKVRMPPRQILRVKSVKIPFRDQAGAEELVILLGAWNRGEDVERCDSRIELLQYAD